MPDSETRAATLLGYFDYGHLPDTLQAISKPFGDLAVQMHALLDGMEAEWTLRKLLEAKDCAVRAALTMSRSNGDRHPFVPCDDRPMAPCEVCRRPEASPYHVRE